MSKTIKVIDLLNIISKGEEIPKKIKVKDYIFIWKVSDNGTGYYNVKEDTVYYWLENYVSLDNSEDLNTEIEIIEEEPEIDIQGIQEFDEIRDISIWSNDTLSYNQREILSKVNKLIRAVKCQQKIIQIQQFILKKN